MDRTLLAVVLWYPLFVIPALPGFVLSIVFFRKIVPLTKFHGACLVLPWLVWIGLNTYDGTGKSLSNVIEASILGAFIGVFVLLEGALKKLGIIGGVHYSKGLLVSGCILAYLLWLFMPGLPE